VLPAATTAITKQINTHLDACATQTDLHPHTSSEPADGPRCPAFDADHTFINDVHWHVTTYPTITLEPTTDGTVQVHTTHAGNLTISYQWSDDVLQPRRWHPATADVTATITGQAVLDHGTPTWVP
jgi:hypothetical protein